jgi:Meckel syndrome type 1 protein
VLLLVAGIALALPGLALADTVAPAADPPVDATTPPDPTTTASAPTDPTAGGPAPDPAATTPTTPPADPATTTTGTTEAPPPAPTPAEATPPPPTATTDGAPVACTPSATSAAPETVCPALVLVETPDPAPAPAPAPAPQQPTQQAPAQAQEPVLAPATETIVTPVSSGDAESTPVLAPLHGGPAGERTPEPSLTLETSTPKPAPPTLVQEERSAPVLTVEPPAPVLAVAPDGLPQLELVPSPTMVDRTPLAALRQAALEPLLEGPVIASTAAVAAGAEPDGSAPESGGELASTGGDEPLPLFPPQDPSENPTGLGAPSSGGGAHGATGVVAILTAFLLLFVPRIVRRLRPTASLAPLVGYRVVLERPG